MTFLHHCHAVGCSTSTPRRMFVCGEHWRRLHYELRYRVNIEYAERERLGTLMHLPYWIACADAIEYLARLDGQDANNNAYRRIAIRLQAKTKGETLNVGEN